MCDQVTGLLAQVRQLTAEAAQIQQQRSKIAQARRQAVRDLLALGVSYGAIARQTGLTKSAVQSIAKAN